MLILVAIGSFVFYKLPGIQDVPSASAEGGRVDVEVKGYRYYWNFTYPNGVIAVDTLRAPVGQTMKLNVTAPDFDVIHSWWIPALGGKIDAIPGQVNETWFSAEAPGVYRGQCAEFCGIQHAEMKAEVEALPREEFEQWLERGGRGPGERHSNLGEETYSGACAKCHGLAGEGDIGPQLAGNRLLADTAAVEHIVRNGRASTGAGRHAAGRQGLGGPPDGRADRLPRGGAARWQLTSSGWPSPRPFPPGSAAGRRAGWSRSTTSGSGSSTSSRPGSSSSPAA